MSPANCFGLFKKTVYQSALSCIFIVCDNICAELGYLGKKQGYSAETEVKDQFLGLLLMSCFRSFFVTSAGGLPAISFKLSVNIFQVFPLRAD